jgi:hypothetical protein
MAWIELHQAVRDHRKIVQVSADLDMPEPHVVGHLAFLWMWSVDNAPDGVLPDSNRVIARAAQFTGDPDAFMSALISAGLVDEEDGIRAIHDWDEYGGKLIHRRDANKERMRNARASHVSSTFANVQSERRVDKRRVDISPPTVPPKDTDRAYSAEFEAFWSASWKAGSKWSAFQRWKRLTLPVRSDASKALPDWTAFYSTADFVQHVETWLNKRMWETDIPSNSSANGRPVKKVGTDEEIASGLYGTY